ncbi:MAG: IS30 family transposase [Bacteroidales bacterium]
MYIAHPHLHSIEERPKEVDECKEPGHWELDCVESTKDDPTALLALTDRISRDSYIFKMMAKTQENVIKCLYQLERRFRHKFKKIFRTITMDNGSEFLDQDSIERSVLTKKKWTTAYYCHPKCPEERGSNENYNKIIRRYVKKK